MTVIRLTKEFSFEMAHTLYGYDGACREIHGHSYRLFVTVKGEPISDASNPKYGMVMDFGELKKIVGKLIVDRYDHALIMRQVEANTEVVDVLKRNFTKVELVDYQPTCENMVPHFAEMIRSELPAGVSLYSVKLHETATSYAEWYASDNE